MNRALRAIVEPFMRPALVASTVVLVCLGPARADDSSGTKVAVRSETESAPEPKRGVWAAHQVVVGTKKIPVLGEVPTRTETFLIAWAEETADGMHLRQQPCTVVFAEVNGVATRLLAAEKGVMPEARIHMTARPDGSLHSQPWVTGWGEEDLDRDGQPGMTVEVDGIPMCSGLIYVASESKLRARLKRVDDSLMVGDLRVVAKQTTLGSDTWCLRVTASDGEQHMKGKVAYKRIDPSSTCESLLRLESWPVRARDP